MKTFVVDEERLALRDRVRALLDVECTPAHVRAAESGGGWSSRRWKALASIGVTGLTLPAEFGGSERDETWVVLVLEEAGRAALPEALGSAWVAGALLADVGSDEQRERWLPAIAAGDAVAAASLPGRQEVEDADVADMILLGEGREVHAFPREAVQLAPRPATDGSRRKFAITATPNARSCLAVRAAAIIALASDRAALAEAALLLGTADKLVTLADSRTQDLDEPAAAVEAARSEVYAAAWSVATDAAGRTAAVKVARTLAAQAAHLAATTLQLHGSTGPEEHAIHLWLRRGLQAPTP